MAGGPGDIGLQETPLTRRWRETLARREGGRDKAEAIIKRLDEMILREKTEVVMIRVR
jgi:hypothetical protein